MEWILDQLPEQRQVVLFSATMPPEIRRLSKRYLKDPAEVTIRTKDQEGKRIRQRSITVPMPHKLEALQRVLDACGGEGVIIFARTKAITLTVAETLEAGGHQVAVLNGDVPQNQRERKRTRNGHPLALTARQFMWIPPQEAAWQLYPVKQHLDPLVQVAAGVRLVVLHRFGNLVDQAHMRVQRGKRVLKDHLHMASCLVQFSFFHGQNINAVDVHAARFGIDKAQQRPADSGFAASRFANQRQGAPLFQREADIFNGVNIGGDAPHQPALQRKARDEVAHIQQDIFRPLDWRRFRRAV